MNAPTTAATGDPVLLARTFQALADEKRVRVLEALGAGERCVCELAEALDVTQPLLSFHLRTLREAGLVSDHRRGRWVYYSLVPEMLAELERAAGALGAGEFASGTIPKGTGRCCVPLRRR
ncbi:MAG: metalloregulator ArsR/SmtB family transcription factor [Gemmatimonadota bacterium]